MEPLFRVLDVFDELGIEYMVGGSLASSIHGDPRATRDVDIIATITTTQAPLVEQRLASNFYVDARMIADAIEHRSSFNVIHRTGFKVDVFVLPERAWDRVAFTRRLSMPCPGEPIRRIFVRTAEDIVLKKLEWFRQGGAVSERQWRDVLGVLRVRRGQLDEGYLRRWARDLGIEDLLDQAAAEASDLES